MATPHSLHHSLLRPSILHILRAAGFTSCRPSVLDTVTDLAARYLITLAESAAYHADLNEHDTEIDIQDVRMAMQDCGLFVAEKMMVDQDFEGEEDTRGVDQFVKWALGKKNREIRRIAMENGDGTKEDYLTGLSSSVCVVTCLMVCSSQEKTQYYGG
jgi:transcription initiation factor TFIID subunit 3